MLTVAGVKYFLYLCTRINENKTQTQTIIKMKKNFCALGLALISLMMLSCGKKTSNDCFIHCTPDTLDAVTQQLVDTWHATPMIPTDSATIDAIVASKAEKTYAEYAGTYCGLSEGYTADTIVDANGWITIRVTKAGITPKCDIVYIHGGAFISPIDPVHVRYCETLVDRFEATVYMALYPLAPATHVTTGIAMLVDAYHTAMKDGLPVYIMGDSAGANLTLSLTLYLKQNGEQLPVAIFPISPMVDFTLSNPEIMEVEKRDPVLTIYFAKSTYGWLEEDMCKKDPLVSPLYGDLTGMPPTLMFVGEDDILCPDAMLLYEKMKENGNRIGVLYGKGLFHVAPIMPLPVQEMWLDEVEAFMAQI